MAREFNRAQRVADLLQRQLAYIIQQELQDPRLTSLTVTAVRVARDLSTAKVFITQLKEEESLPATLKALNKAANRLRYLLAQQVELRTVPQLHFVHDASIQQGSHLSALIDAAIAADEHKHKKNNES